MNSNSSGGSGAPLKPWEVARIQSTGTVSGPVSTTPYSTSNNPEDDQKQQTQIIPSYSSYPRYNTNTYTSPYQSPSPYGMTNGYYGYPTSYPGSGTYGNYNYGRPSPWSHQQPMYPGLPPPGGDDPKPPMWQRFVEGLHKVVSAFGRVSFLVDENTQAFHFFITALLALMDKAGSLYGELMRYIMKLLGIGRRRRRALIANSPNKQSTPTFEKQQTADRKHSTTES